MTACKVVSLRQELEAPLPALDVHVHPLSCFGAERPESPAEDARRLLAAAKRSGVTHLCVFSLDAECPREPTPEQCRRANDYVLRMRDAEPEHILPFCYVSPEHPDAAVAEIDRCVGAHRGVGIKLWVARRATDPGLDPIAEKAIQHGVPVLQHAWIKTTGNLPGESTPADVADLARRHPRLRIIMAHLNGHGLRGIEEVADYPNIAVDIAGGDPETGMVERALDRLGPERVVYGSDAPIRHFGVQLAKALGARVDDDTRGRILWHNAAALLPEWALQGKRAR